MNIAITIPDFVLDDLVRILQPLLNYLLDLRLLSIRMAKESSYISTTLERWGYVLENSSELSLHEDMVEAIVIACTLPKVCFVV